jgi:hypothetical protein
VQRSAQREALTASYTLLTKKEQDHKQAENNVNDRKKGKHFVHLRGSTDVHVSPTTFVGSPSVFSLVTYHKYEEY